MTESDGYETVYASRWGRRTPHPMPLRTRLTDDQAELARRKYERGSSVRSIAIRFRATNAAVIAALEEGCDDEPKGAA